MVSSCKSDFILCVMKKNTSHVMQKNLDYCNDLTPLPHSPKFLEDGLILAMLSLKLELNNRFGKNLAKEEYLPFTTGLIAMSSLKKRSFFPIVVTPSFSSVVSSSRRLLNNAFPSISSSTNF